MGKPPGSDSRPARVCGLTTSGRIYCSDFTYEYRCTDPTLISRRRRRESSSQPTHEDLFDRVRGWTNLPRTRSGTTCRMRHRPPCCYILNSLPYCKPDRSTPEHPRCRSPPLHLRFLRRLTLFDRPAEVRPGPSELRCRTNTSASSRAGKSI